MDGLTPPPNTHLTPARYGTHIMHDAPLTPLDVFFAIAYGAALGLLLAAFI